ncbi:helicase domain-containing protein [[Clostridium] sordellii]|uniref:DEAD/DEAH box helicase n=1 Tax=Paraclostridium sordellii TaxID=1505 RepID=UPI0005E8E2CB|nr:DEAD/DEAH box helicase [Paeniclostridium sordellii]CEO35453.1 helicase domain-containing protein [[Clostridium] sordellii] [Paeniclostridium sordellii]CEP92791.1 helicase domain-containing protein [[Clostridium] sordellii] [Paeniclostridium sordellii]
MKNILTKRANEIISNIKKESTSLIVLKGIDLDYIGSNKVDLEKYMDNKFMYLDYLRNTNNIISYDEFVCFYEAISLFYKKIYVIDNNIYINFYPINVNLSNQKLNTILSHYDEDSSEDAIVGDDIQEYTNIYGNIIKVNNNYYVVYNDMISDEKVSTINMWNEENIENTIKRDFTEGEHTIEVIDEISYLNLIDTISVDSLKSINLIDDFNSNDKYSIKQRIGYLVNCFKDTIKITLGRHKVEKIKQKEYPEYIKYLKKYWGKDSFLDVSVYDMDELENGNKILTEVSQGEIIDTIIQQCKKAKNNKDFNDIFITAPTGSGKSAMFQIPAMYLTECDEEPLLTIVISPLIGLMKDQVKNLEIKNYQYARTINSDISPIKKDEIKDDIAENKCHILYISPETLLSRSDVEQLIGNRKIGLFIIDEAHIVTTWGKQFRPDYWFLGDHIKKIRKTQEERYNSSFPLATFTATAIYKGVEDMYSETKQSLNMIDPITYLGKIKREDIDIRVQKTDKKTNSEYELSKFDQLIEQIKIAKLFNKKTLIYFPTVSLISRFYDHCYIKGVSTDVAKYHGQMAKWEKDENYENFYNKKKLVMLATKAFGMGIDIEDIEKVIHFAPTGNVCDYLQEIGRAARRRDLDGEAYYEYMSNDFKHINRLHGISMVKEYQLVEVIKKIHELYVERQKIEKGNSYTKKRRSMLVDAESFSHIFESPLGGEDDAINKVKTAMLVIQKDFERRGYAPFHIRPIPLFAVGYFKIDEINQRNIKRKYKETLQVVNEEDNICSLNLEKIWEKQYSKKYSFPQFKYMVYTKHEDLDFEFKNAITPALILNIYFDEGYKQRYNNIISEIKSIINLCIRQDKFYSIEDLANQLKERTKMSEYNAMTIMDILVTAMRIYAKDHTKTLQGRLVIEKPLKNGQSKYRFNNAIEQFFKWIDRKLTFIENNLKDGSLYIVNDSANDKYKEYLLLLGVLEILEVLTFKSTGGSNSQIYMYINETKTMKQIIEKPYKYKNNLLKEVNRRHNISVCMLSYLFDNDLSSEEIWNNIEDYFLGSIPDEVKKIYKKKYNEEILN